MQSARGATSPLRIAIAAIAARGFRSDAALEAIANASSKGGGQSLALYNYPSFSATLAAAFVKLYHSRLSLPCLILPFSSLIPFRKEDIKIEGLEHCYLLDLIGPKGFSAFVSNQSKCKVSVFDHRKSSRERIHSGEEDHPEVTFHCDSDQNSCRAVYTYFSQKLASLSPSDLLVNSNDQKEVESVIDFLEDIDLNRWSFPDVQAFKIGRDEWKSMVNCITNPRIFDQILKVKSKDLIDFGKSYHKSREDDASEILEKAFKVRLGGGDYGECLGVRADGYTHLINEIGTQLSVKSSEVGLRPIGAVVFLHRRNKLKMCLRTTDEATDTSVIAKAYGGGGKRFGSSFNIRMDDYNKWTSRV